MGLLKIVWYPHMANASQQIVTVIGTEQTSFDICSIYPQLREGYQMRTKAFAIARLLLLYRPHILILGKLVCSFAIYSAFVWYMCMWLK